MIIFVTPFLRRFPIHACFALGTALTRDEATFFVVLPILYLLLGVVCIGIAIVTRDLSCLRMATVCYFLTYLLAPALARRMGARASPER